MAPLPDYVTGTITLTNGSPNFTGDGTGWLAAGFREGDTILGIEDNEGVVYVIESITDNDAGTLTQDWQGATGEYTYRMRYLSDGQRVTAQARQLIELLGNGNLQAVAGLPGTPQTLMMFTGPGAMVEVPRTDLVSGAAYDVQVDELADRDAYDSEDAGFAVLVSDVGDGRAAIYSKLSNTAGDWSDPAYITGPVGPIAEVTVGTTTTGAPGTPASVTGTPTVDGVELDFTIPAGEGFSAEGDYSGSTAYVKGDVVQQMGSSWIALQATTGNAPPTFPTTSNAYWQLLARAGADGAGTVTSLSGGTGIDIDSTDPTVPVVSAVAFTGDSGSGGTLGAVPAPSAGDAAGGKLLGAGGGWVDPPVAGGPVDAKTADYTVLAGDNGKAIVVDASAAARTITLPAAATAGNGFRIIIKKTDNSANTVTVDGDGSETIDGALTKVLRLEGQSVALICDGSNWLVMADSSLEQEFIHVQDQKSNGTNGGTFTQGAWQTRDLNTVLINTITGASLSANQVSLPAGVYRFDGSAPTHTGSSNIGNHKTRLYNVTDSVVLQIGTKERLTMGNTGVNASIRSFVAGWFVIASPAVIELQHMCETTQSNTGFGNGGGIGGNELYADLKIWKVA